MTEWFLYILGFLKLKTLQLLLVSGSSGSQGGGIQSPYTLFGTPMISHLRPQAKPIHGITKPLVYKYFTLAVHVDKIHTLESLELHFILDVFLIFENVYKTWQFDGLIQIKVASVHYQWKPDTFVSSHWINPLTTRNPGKHKWILVSIVAADGLVLQHQAISTHIAASWSIIHNPFLKYGYC